MPDPTLTQYIKQNLTAGFSEEEIRQALLQAGWRAIEIEEGFGEVKSSSSKFAASDIKEYPEGPGFFSKYRKTLITVLVILVALPLLTYGGFLGYKKFLSPNKPSALTGPQSQTQPTGPSAEEQARAAKEKAEKETKSRDQQRVSDIQATQTALDNFLVASKFYPKNLNQLVDQNLLSKVPVDPLSKKPYLYSALGNPALYYSLSFLLESDIGTLQKGLQVVSSEQKLSADLIRSQDELIRGQTTSSPSNILIITDLSQKPFYPQEEVLLEVTVPQNLKLGSVYLIMEGLDLVDRKSPYSFQFTAPKNPGTYPVQVFAFDSNGNGYFQKTTLIVTAKP